MVSLRDAFNPVYRFNRLKRRLNIKYPRVLFNLSPTLKQDDARIADEIREMFVNLTQGEDIHDPPPLSWSTLIVSKGGPNNGYQKTSPGRDRYKIASG